MPVVPVPTAPAPAPATSTGVCPCCGRKLSKRGVPKVFRKVGHALLSLVHDKQVDQGFKKLLPVLIVRVVVYAGGSVETAKLIQQAVHAAGF